VKYASKLPDEEIRERAAAGLMVFPLANNALTSGEPKSQSEGQRAGIEIITVGYFPMANHRRILT
jgi:hypothetical protein